MHFPLQRVCSSEQDRCAWYASCCDSYSPHSRPRDECGTVGVVKKEVEEEVEEEVMLERGGDVGERRRSK